LTPGSSRAQEAAGVFMAQEPKETGQEDEVFDKGGTSPMLRED